MHNKTLKRLWKMDFLNVSVVHGKMLNETLRKSFSPQDT